jgi:hypothetical protein
VIGHGRCGGSLRKAADGDSGDSRNGAGSQSERRRGRDGAPQVGWSTTTVGVVCRGHAHSDGVLGTVHDRVRLWAVEAGLRSEVKASDRLGGVWGLVRDGVPRLASEASGHDDFRDWGAGLRRRSGEGLGDSF